MSDSGETEIQLTYWKGVFVPVVISILILSAFAVFLAVNPGKPHPLVAPWTGGGVLPKAFRSVR